MATFRVTLQVTGSVTVLVKANTQSEATEVGVDVADLFLSTLESNSVWLIDKPESWNLNASGVATASAEDEGDDDED